MTTFDSISIEVFRALIVVLYSFAAAIILILFKELFRKRD